MAKFRGLYTMRLQGAVSAAASNLRVVLLEAVLDQVHDAVAVANLVIIPAMHKRRANSGQSSSRLQEVDGLKAICWIPSHIGSG